jgi:hypothetical protein
MTPSTDTDIGTIGRRRRARGITPEETLANFRKQNPDATSTELREIARQYVVANTVFEDLAANNFTMWLVDKALARSIKDEPSPEIAREKAAERAALKQQLIEAMGRADEERIETIITVRLLEYETPYGKALGDCTGAECARLSRRYGGFFSELSKRITRAETVRAHLTESELQAIATTHRLIGEKAAR